MEGESTTSRERFPRLTDEQIDAKFKGYVRAFDLKDADLAKGKSICVIGAGANVFAAGLKRARPDGNHAFVMGVDPAENRYHQLDSAIINHDARDLGFPENLVQFDRVISMDAVPKYFFMWSAPKHEKEHVIKRGGDIYDYSVGERGGSEEEVGEAIYKALSEMLRVTKPGGKVSLYPIAMARSGMETEEQYLVTQAVMRLAKIYPKIDMYIGTDQEVSLPGLSSAPLSPFVKATFEIIKPKKSIKFK